MARPLKGLALAAGVLAFPLAVASCGDGGPAEAPRVKEAWARATPDGASRTALYLTIVNEADRPVTVTGASAPVAAAAELHETVASDSGTVMRQRDRVTVPAGSVFRFKPADWHVMLLGLERQLNRGRTIKFSLHFAERASWSGEADITSLAAPEYPTVR